MPTPISTNNSSFYDPNASFTPAEAADASGAICGLQLQAPTSSQEVTIPPIVITGDASAQQLVKGHDAARGEPSCSLEAKTAALSCAKAGLAAAGGLLASSTLVGAALGVSVTFAESITCGKDLRAYSDCKSE